MYPSTPTTQRVFQPIPADVERLGKIALNAAFKVHATLGPGLLESVYQVAMKHVIEKSGVAVKTDVKLPIMFEGIKLESGLHLDMLVEKCVIVELFSVEKMNPLYQKQLLTRSEEHTSELQSLAYLVCRLLLEKKKCPSCPDSCTCPHTRPYRPTCG